MQLEAERYIEKEEAGKKGGRRQGKKEQEKRSRRQEKGAGKKVGRRQSEHFLSPAPFLPAPSFHDNPTI
jgi:hypothetical protein